MMTCIPGVVEQFLRSRRSTRRSRSRTSSAGAIEAMEPRRLLATFVPTTAADLAVNPGDGQLTLREAILQANATPADDTIVLSGTYFMSIAGFAENDGQTGDFDILPGGGKLSIVGNPSAAIVAADASQNLLGDRIFDVRPNQPGFTLVDVVLSSGRADAERGGAIRSAGLDTQLVRTTLTANQAFAGGGMVVTAGDVTIFASTFANNLATSGGMSVGDAGGGLLVLGGSTTVSDSTFAGNSADGGGGLAVANATLNLNNSTVSNNTARETAGGGILAAESSTVLRVTGGTVGGNNIPAGHGEGGGGIAVINDALGEIRQSSILENFAIRGGGVLIQSSKPNLVENTLVRENEGDVFGAGIYIDYDDVNARRSKLTITGSWIDANFTSTASTAFGGGIHNAGSDLVVRDTTISNNIITERGGGAGIYNTAVSADANVWLTNSTISGNRLTAVPESTGGGGGGILSGTDGSFTPAVYISSSTIAENFAYDSNTNTAFGGGILRANSPNVLEVRNTVIANNTGLDVAESNTTSQPVDHGGLWVGDTYGDPMLGALEENFKITGLAPTHRPLRFSPLRGGGSTLVAIDVASGQPLTTDQRGWDRIQGTIDIGAVEVQTQFTVGTLSDADDGNYAPGALSLREAVKIANFYPGAATIKFAPSAIGTVALNSALGHLAIFDVLTIDGHGVGQTVLDGGDVVRIVFVTPGATVTLSNMTLTRGHAGGGDGGAAIVLSSAGQPASLTLRDVKLSDSRAVEGGGVLLRANDADALLVLERVEMTGNTATQHGGAVSLDTGGSSGNATVEARESTLWANSATLDGGAIYLSDPRTSALLTNSTISGNVAGRNGGAAYVGAPALLATSHATITDNRAAISGGGIHVNAGAAVGPNLINTVVAANHLNSGAPSDIVGPFLDVAGNFIGGDPKLAPLADNGGPTRTHKPLAGSPLVDAGNNAQSIDLVSGDTLTVDQRGEQRRRDADGNGTATVDTGAVEVTFNDFRPLTVDTTADEDDGDYSIGDLSLREAIGLAKLRFGDDTVVLPAGVYGLTLGELQFDDTENAVTIVGSGQPIISSGGASRVVFVDFDVTATISGVVITGGSSPNTGGGIVNAGTLTLDRARVVNNDAFAEGGGIQNLGVLTLIDSVIGGNEASRGAGLSNLGTAVVRRSLIAGNTATAASDPQGGGVRSTAGAALFLINSTVSGNSVTSAADPAFGGGIALVGGTALLVNSTVYNNSSNRPNGIGGIVSVVPAGSLQLANTVVAGNVNAAGPSDVFGDFNEPGPNFIGTRDGEALLGPLTDNGGLTQSHRPLPGSPLVDAGSNAAAVDPVTPGPLAVDQRGQQRIRDGNNDAIAIVDIGAVEATLAETRPAAISSAFQFETRQAVSVRFNGNVFASIDASDLLVTNTTTNETFSAQSIEYDAATNTATWILSGPGGLLTDGDYVATLPAAAVSASGQVLAADVTVEFFVLAGDANRDRRVNLEDFNILAAHFGGSGKTWSQADFNYDGTVNLADFNILASRFGTTVAAASPADLFNPNGLARNHVGFPELDDGLRASGSA